MSDIVNILFERAPNLATDLSENQQERLEPNTLGLNRTIHGFFYPNNTEELAQIIHWAHEQKQRLYVVSRGRNWGYGSRIPVADDCYVLSLERMNRILSFDRELGLVKLEPGVSQEDLDLYLKENSLPFICPTTGAGPSASVLGNALDRGFGITPLQDHFSALMSVEVILGDGRSYQSVIHSLGGHQTDTCLRWGTGPYLSGLFSQSNLGVVASGTLRLAPRPERIFSFVIHLDLGQLKEAVEQIRETRQRLGSLCGGINLMQSKRLEALMRLEQGVKARSISHKDWTILGALYVPKRLERSVKSEIKGLYRDLGSVRFWDQNQNQLLLRLVRPLRKWLPGTYATLYAVDQSLSVLEGHPSSYPLRLAYWQRGLEFQPPNIKSELNPDQDGVGLLWFAPILPKKSELVLDFHSRLSDICKEHSVEPIATYISISEIAFDCTLPIFFDKADPESEKRAKACRDRLWEMALSLGVMPHRYDIEVHPRIWSSDPGSRGFNCVARDLLKEIKEICDPHGVISPGKYGPS